MSRRDGGRSQRLVGGAGVALGVALLTRGADVFTRVEGRGPSSGEATAVTVLGARHLGQGLLQLVLPHRFARLYALVDSTHALSMGAAAAAWPARRRATLLSGGLAATAAVLAWRARSRR